MRAWWEELSGGLFSASPWSFVGALLVAATELCLLVLLLTPSHIARLNPQLLMLDPGDDYGRVTVLGFRLREHPPGTLGVVLVGTSTARASIFDATAPRPIEIELAARLHEPVTFHSVYAHGSTLKEEALVVDQMPPRFRGVMTLFVHDAKDDRWQVAERAKQGKGGELLALDPPSWGAETSHARTGIWFFDHLGFVTARRRLFFKHDMAVLRLPRGGKPSGFPPLPGTEARTYSQYKRHRMPVVRDSLPEIAHILETARARGALPILVEAETSPAFIELEQHDHAVFVEEMKKLAAAHGSEFWQLGAEAGITANDFGDSFHMANPEARLRYQDVFIQHLVPKLAEAK